MVKLTIQGRLPSLNEYTRACRGDSWYKGAQLKKDTQELIRWYIKCHKLKPCKSPVRVKFKWYEPNKRRDYDNIAFAKKFILDALVEEGILEDDGWNFVRGFEDSFDVDKDEPRIEVTIIEES